jgi:4-azaleucine resistance transporter AzlC
VSSPRAEFLAGVRAELPILVGVMPFGLIYGVVAIAAGLPPALALAMSFIVFAGSAQFIGADMVRDAVPGPIMVLTTFIVNLRHMLYSASLAPYVRHLPRRWKWLLAYLLTDEAYAVVILNYQRIKDLTHAHWFYLGAGLTLWTTWQASTAVGVFLGANVPSSWGLDFTLALSFIGLVMLSLQDRATLAAALSAGLAAVAAYGLPYRLGLLVAALVGIVVGLAIESMNSSQQTPGTQGTVGTQGSSGQPTPPPQAT